jgi:DNA-binding FadR family transcriptional regulator
VPIIRELVEASVISQASTLEGAANAVIGVSLNVRTDSLFGRSRLLDGELDFAFPNVAGRTGMPHDPRLWTHNPIEKPMADRGRTACVPNRCRVAAMTAPTRKDGSKGDASIDRTRPAYEEVASRLRTEIADGKLTPGDRLPAESKLAADFGVSRSTIREALRVLNSEGLIRTARGVSGGSFVTETEPSATSDFLQTRLGILSRHQAITTEELLETRALLEVAGAALAAERRTAGHLDELRKVVEQERDFHVSLLSAAQNRLLEAMAVPVVGQLLSTHASNDHGPAQADLDHDHERILERIEARDPEGAAEAMEQHLKRLASAYRRATPSPSTA